MDARKLKNWLNNMGMEISIRIYFFLFFVVGAVIALFIPFDAARIIRDEIKTWRL
jgi:hypothetical protein